MQKAASSEVSDFQIGRHVQKGHTKQTILYGWKKTVFNFTG